MKPLESPEDVMPWVGVYVTVASLVCILAMAADTLHGFWRWKLWFPNKYFTLNAASLTLIGIAMKLPVDLNSDKSNGLDDLHNAKVVSLFFLFAMLANFLPSLGLMNEKELLVNMVALGILIITINVNILIQTVTHVVEANPGVFFMLIFTPLWVFSVALIVPASRRNLKHQYKELHILGSNDKEIQFSYKEFVHNVKKYWMMAETGNPQFALACSQVSSAFGVVCSIFFVISILMLIYNDLSYVGNDEAGYKWSVKLILIVQLVGVVVGSIAPILRCFTSITYFYMSKKSTKSRLNVFRVEKHWIQMLRLWKRSHVSSKIPGRHCKIVIHFFRNTILNICIALQVTVVILCKIICLLQKFLLMIMFSCCWRICKSLLKRLRFEPSVSEMNVRAEMEKYKIYILQVEDDANPSKRMLRNTLNSITRLLQGYEKKTPRNLITLLHNSKGFVGVVEFDDERVAPLSSDEFQNSWGLVAVTLTAIAIALPSIANDRVKELVFSMSEGIYFVRHVEENLNPGEELENSRKASRRLGAELEVYRTWLKIDLQNKARKGKTSKEILQWLGDEAEKIVKKFKDDKNASLDHSFHKFVAANSMYRISQTLLLHYNAQQNSPTDKEVFERVTSLMADILLACFTNLPRVITMKCHHDAIEKRQDSIRTAAHILGKSKEILNILQALQLPNIDMDSMAYVDKWRALSKNQIPSDSNVANSEESLTITIT